MAVTRKLLLPLSALVVAAVVSGGEPKKITYEDDVLPIFRNNCLKCHNPDKLKGDLDLTSFSAAIKGGGSGATVNAGDPDGSQLMKSILQSGDPTMPPNSKLNDREIDTIRHWIEGGLLQGVGSKAIAASKPTVDLALKSGSIGKPDGPPPMPGLLPLEPLVRATRGSALSAVASSPWAPVVALGGARQIALYNTADLEFIGVLPFPEGSPCDVKFSRNGKLLLASGGRGGQSGLVTVWDIAKGERVITVGDQFDSVLAADLSSDQQWIALGGPDRLLKVYATKDGALEHKMKKHTEWVTAVEFSPDGKFLASGDRNGGLLLWETESGQEMFSLPGHKAGITAISWRSDSAVFVSASEDGTLKWWKAADGSAIRSITAHAGGALAVRYAQDGRIVSCGRDNKVQIWDGAGKNSVTLAFSGELPNRVSFNDDGSRVIGSDWKGRVLVWETKTGKMIGELEANPPMLADRVKSCSERLAALEKEIASASAAQTVAEKEDAVAQGKLAQAATTLADFKAVLAVKEAEVGKLASAPVDETGKKNLVTARAAVATVKARLVELEKENAAAAKVATAARKKATDAKTKVTEVTAKFAAAKTSLAKWQAVLQTAKTSNRGKVTLR